MAQRKTQIGGSDRGPAELDQAKANRGLPPQDVTITEDEDRALASGETEDEAEAAAEDRGAGAPQTGRRLRHEPRVRSAEEDEAVEAARSEQPGGDVPSESERPAGGQSRWGTGPGRSH